MEEDIAALDMSPEAAAGGRATIQAYIDAADDMLPLVQAAYANVARAARLALQNNVLDSIGYEPLSYRNIPTPSELLQATRAQRGYASGTDDAPPGWSWVGEEGPELMRLHGGEQILPANVSQEVARDYRAYNEYSGEYAAARAVQGIQSRTPAPLEVVAGGQTSDGTKLEMHFHIEAGASPETVNAWQDYANSAEFRATVMEAVEDAQADVRRRSMA